MSGGLGVRRYACDNSAFSSPLAVGTMAPTPLALKTPGGGGGGLGGVAYKDPPPPPGATAELHNPAPPLLRNEGPVHAQTVDL